MTGLLGRMGQVVRRIGWSLFLAPLGRGRPFSARQWDEQYRTGRWEYLKSLDQLGNHAVIGGLVRRLSPSGRILELGCGNGLLLRELMGLPLAGYTGVDLSEEALLHARALAARTAGSFPWDFRLGDFEEYTPDEEPDLVIFAESLYYASYPVDVLERYRAVVREGGALIVSMYRYRNTAAIWRQVSRRFPVLCSIRVENDRGQEWDIRVLGTGC